MGLLILLVLINFGSSSFCLQQLLGLMTLMCDGNSASLNACGKTIRWPCRTTACMVSVSSLRIRCSIAYRHEQNYENLIHNIKGIIKTSRRQNNLSNVDKIYQTKTFHVIKNIKWQTSVKNTKISAHTKINIKGNGSNQLEDLRK